MGIDNSRAAQSEFRLALALIFCWADQKELADVSAQNRSEEDGFNTIRKSGRRTHLPRVIGTMETLGGL